MHYILQTAEVRQSLDPENGATATTYSQEVLAGRKMLTHDRFGAMRETYGMPCFSQQHIVTDKLLTLCDKLFGI